MQCPALQEDEYRNGNFYAFHAKWNPQGDRLMLVVRWVPPTPIWRRLLLKAASKKYMRKHVVTMAADGTDVQLAVSAEDWARGGHHPNWCPDGRHVMMNLNIHGDGLRFVQFRYDGGPPADHAQCYRFRASIVAPKWSIRVDRYLSL